MIGETSRNKLKKHSVTKNCSDLSHFKKIVFLTVGQNNFGSKIPILHSLNEPRGSVT